MGRRRPHWYLKRSHFAAAGGSPEAVRDAVRRFGDPEPLINAFRHAYRWSYVSLYVLKIAASVIASMGAALLIQVFVKPSFFGQDSRYGHRLYAGVIINTTR
jgi:hypothetical protein